MIKKNGVHERSLESSRDDDFVIVDKREARLYLPCRNRRICVFSESLFTE